MVTKTFLDYEKLYDKTGTKTFSRSIDGLSSADLEDCKTINDFINNLPDGSKPARLMDISGCSAPMESNGCV